MKRKSDNIKNEDDYLRKQLITYLGNKRSLLCIIEEEICSIMKKIRRKKVNIFDVFSGSGAVSRLFKKYADNLYVNDLENYCTTLSKCYLTNKSSISIKKLNAYYKYLISNLTEDRLKSGFITKLYSPEDDSNIKLGERVFYTHRNAMYIDTARQLLNDVPEPYKTLFLGPLLFEASTKNNTCGVFKGFYKNSTTNLGQFGGNGRNAIKRIMAPIELKKPVLSNYDCKVHVLQGDSNIICKDVKKVDIAYLDPPYNQHPYSSNYFMLNLINDYIEPKNISKVSGIPSNWNKSDYNKRSDALESLQLLCKNLDAKYIIVSYNSEGFISYNEMYNMLSTFGKVTSREINYYTYKASRNLRNRSIYVKEYLFVLKKEK